MLEQPLPVKDPFGSKATPLTQGGIFRGRSRNENGGASSSTQTERIVLQRDNPAAEARAHQESWPPPLLDETRATMSRALVRELRGCLQLASRAPPVALLDWQNKFLDIAEEYVREEKLKGLHSVTDDELLEVFKSKLADGRLAAIANVVIESQLEALQAATTAHSKVGEEITSWHGSRKPTDIEERKYVAPPMSSSPTGTEVATDAHEGGSWWHRAAAANPFFRKLTGAGNVRRVENALKREGRKRWNIIHQIVFARDAKLDMDGHGIEGGLSESQKAYLRSVIHLDTIPNGALIPPGAKEVIVREMMNLMDARANYYAHHDRVLTHEDYNMVRVQLGLLGDLARVYYSSNTSPRRILMDRYGLPGVELVVGRDVNRYDVLSKIADKLHAEAKERAERMARDEAVRSAVDDRIKVLEAMMEDRPLTEDEQRHIQQLDAEIAAKTSILNLLKEIESVEERLQAIPREIAEVTAGIDPEILEYRDPDPKNYASLAYFQEQHTSQNNQLQTIQRDIARKQGEIARLNDSIAQLRKQQDVALGKNNNQAYTQLKQEIDGLTQKAEALWSEIETTGGLEDQKRELEAKINATNGEILKRQEALRKYQDQIAQLEARQQEERGLLLKKKGLETKLNIVAPTSGQSLADLKTAAQTAILSLQVEKRRAESAGKPDQFRARELQVLRVFRGKIATDSAYGDIMNRARRRANGITMRRKIDLARQRYPRFSSAYLRTVSLMFGETALASTREGRELFRDAAALLSPEEFAALAKKYSPSGGPVTDAGQVTPEFINFVIDHMHEQALKGKLGVLDETQQTRIRQLEEVVPLDITAERSALRREVAKAVEGYDAARNVRRELIRDYVNGEVVKTTSWSTIAAELNTKYFNGAPVFSEEQLIKCHNEQHFEPGIPDGKALEQVAQLAASNSERGMPQLFLAAAGELVKNRDVYSKVEARLLAGEPVEDVARDPAYAAEAEGLLKSLYFASSSGSFVAGILYILPPDHAQQFTKGILNGKSIVESALGLDSTVRDQIEKYTKETLQALAKRPLADFESGLAVAQELVSRASQERPNLNPSGTTDAILSQMVSVGSRVDGQRRLMRTIQFYDRSFPYYDSVADLARRIMNAGYETDPARAMMMAQEVNKLRVTMRHPEAVMSPPAA